MNKPPTAPGISRMLNEAGHPRAGSQRAGFRVSQDRTNPKAVLVRFLSTGRYRLSPDYVRSRLSAYSATLADAGWQVDAGAELTVTAKETS